MQNRLQVLKKGEVRVSLPPVRVAYSFWFPWDFLDVNIESPSRILAKSQSRQHQAVDQSWFFTHRWPLHIYLHPWFPALANFYSTNIPTMQHIRITWGALKTMDVEHLPFPPLEVLTQLAWHEAWAIMFYKNSPGNSNVQPGLGTTGLWRSLGNFHRDE